MLQIQFSKHPDGPSPVVPFIYDMVKKELKVATAKDTPVHSPFLAAVNGTLVRYVNEYSMQPNMMSGEGRKLSAAHPNPRL